MKYFENIMIVMYMNNNNYIKMIVKKEVYKIN